MPVITVTKDIPETIDLGEITVTDTARVQITILQTLGYTVKLSIVDGVVLATARIK